MDGQPLKQHDVDYHPRYDGSSSSPSVFTIYRVYSHVLTIIRYGAQINSTSSLNKFCSVWILTPDLTIDSPTACRLKLPLEYRVSTRMRISIRVLGPKMSSVELSYNLNWVQHIDLRYLSALVVVAVSLTHPASRLRLEGADIVFKCGLIRTYFSWVTGCYIDEKIGCLEICMAILSRNAKKNKKRTIQTHAFSRCLFIIIPLKSSASFMDSSAPHEIFGETSLVTNTGIFAYTTVLFFTN